MAPVQTDLLSAVRGAVDWDRLVGPQGVVLCALSGGPDSVALCDLLDWLKNEIAFLLRAAHFNHKIRGAEAEADEDFVREFCRERDIDLVVGHEDVPGLAATSNLSLEMAAREARHDFLIGTAARLGCKAVALGHTSDDRVETLLLRLFRGSGGRGLGSLQPVREREGLLLLRPLLDVSRTEILAYLKLRGLSYRIDSSNLSDITDRARIRNILLPRLVALAEECGWEKVCRSLARSAALLAEDENWLGEQAERYLGAVEIDKKTGIRFPFDTLGTLPSPVLARVILAAIERMDPSIRPEREHVRNIEDLIRGAREGACDLPGGLRAESAGDAVLVHMPLRPTASAPSPAEIRLDKLPLSCEFGPYRIEFIAIDPGKERTQTSVGPSHVRMTIALRDDCKKLLLRAPLQGDRMAPLGMGGHTKKLSDIFADRKVARELRGSQPVLVDSSDGTILALPTLGLVAESGRIDDEVTRAMVIETSAAGGDMVT